MKSIAFALAIFASSATFAAAPKKPFLTCTALNVALSPNAIAGAALYEEVIVGSVFLRVNIVNGAQKVVKALRGSILPVEGVLNAKDIPNPNLGIGPGYESAFSMNNKLEARLVEGRGLGELPRVTQFVCEKVK